MEAQTVGLGPELELAAVNAPPAVLDDRPSPTYKVFTQALDALRQLGVRLAFDDAGAGYASLKHILQLTPDFISWTLRSRKELTPILLGGLSPRQCDLLFAPVPVR